LTDSPPHPEPSTGYQRLIPHGHEDNSVIHSHLVLRSRMWGVLPSFPLQAFTAWYLGNITFKSDNADISEKEELLYFLE
jgi:hypothetical protein